MSVRAICHKNYSYEDLSCTIHPGGRYKHKCMCCIEHMYVQLCFIITLPPPTIYAIIDCLHKDQHSILQWKPQMVYRVYIVKLRVV